MKNKRKRIRSLTLALAVGGLLGGPQAVWSQSFDRGEALYEHHCQACHESWAHERAGRHVTTLEQLRRRVAGWSFHSGLDWGDEEIDDVTDYLNRTFYQMTR